MTNDKRSCVLLFATSLVVWLGGWHPSGYLDTLNCIVFVSGILYIINK